MGRAWVGAVVAATAAVPASSATSRGRAALVRRRAAAAGAVAARRRRRRARRRVLAAPPPLRPRIDLAAFGRWVLAHVMTLGAVVLLLASVGGALFYSHDVVLAGLVVLVALATLLVLVLVPWAARVALHAWRRRR
jgi:hypothetical protein